MDVPPGRYNPLMRPTCAFLFIPFLFIATAGMAQVAEGDQQWALRAEGHTGGHANAARIDAAIAAYQRALAQKPDDLEAHWKLLRAFRFKGSYVATTDDQEKTYYGQGKAAGEKAFVVLNRMLVAKGVSSSDKAAEKQVADAARSIPGAAECYFWDSANWGQWALVYGKMAALREGAADRIKREATIAMLIDPKLDGGGGARVLGRLHDQTPHVPFITGWASGKEAVKYLRESLKYDPTNKITIVFLAEAMVDDNSDTKPQAIKMLRDAIAAPSDPDFVVEQDAAAGDAKELLKKWGAS
jgi:tetratricopeptide (TPR) repeat protein